MPKCMSLTYYYKYNKVSLLITYAYLYQLVITLTCALRQPLILNTQCTINQTYDVI